MTPSLRTARRAIAGAALLGASALLAACGTNGGQAAPTRTVTVSATPSSQGSSSVSPSPVPAVTTSAPASPSGPAPCPTRYLKLKLGLSQGAAGSIYQVIDFTNIGTATCTLYGYPGVSFAAGSPVTQVGLAAKEDPSAPRQLVTLAPHAVANALLRIVQTGDFPASTCAPVSTTFMVIYPPNQTTPVYIAYNGQACSKLVRFLTVSVVKPGSGG